MIKFYKSRVSSRKVCILEIDRKTEVYRLSFYTIIHSNKKVRADLYSIQKRCYHEISIMDKKYIDDIIGGGSGSFIWIQVPKGECLNSYRRYGR